MASSYDMAPSKVGDDFCDYTWIWETELEIDMRVGCAYYFVPKADAVGQGEGK